MSHSVLITGATDGIGLALAQRYAAQGARLVLVGRRPRAELDPALFAESTYCQSDLSLPTCAAIVAAFLADQQIDRLDRVIHNAGIGFYGPVARQSADSIRDLIAVNLRAPIALTHTLLPQLTRAHGQLVFISSVAANLPAPDYAVYGATKAALDSFAYNLRIEQQGAIMVQIIHPGATRTAMHAKSGAPIRRMNVQHFPAPAHVAAQIAHAIEAGKQEATIGAANRLARFAGQRFGGVVDWVVGRVTR